MCNAYTLTQSGDKITNAFDLDGENDFAARYNIRPTQLAPVIIQGDKLGLSFFYWGATPQFAQNKPLAKKLYNTKTESLTEVVVHRTSLEQRRCLIPADGFYSWRKISKKGQVPYRYYNEDSQLFAFAGIWQEFEDIDGKKAHTFSILTTLSNDLIAQSTPRMPVILDIDNGLKWLKSSFEESSDYLNSPNNDGLIGFAVSNRVNNPANDDPGLIEPAPPADQFGNYSLFD